MDTPLPSGILNGDCHGAFQRTTSAVDKTISIRWTCEPVEEGGSKVDEDDAPEGLANGQRDSYARVLGLGGGHSDGFDTGIEGATEDEDLCNASKPIYERTRVMPVTKPNSFGSNDSARSVADNVSY